MSTGLAEIWDNLSPGKGSPKSQSHNFSMTMYPMCIFVLFRSRNTLMLKQIQDEIHIPEDELQHHLMSLRTHKHRILCKGSKGKQIMGDKDTFMYNPKYTYKMKRVKVPMVSMRDTTSSSGSNSASAGENSNESASIASLSSLSADLVYGSPGMLVTVEEDQRYLLEVAMVHIIKVRKTCDHNNFVVEAKRQMLGWFIPLPQFLKKRVTSLINREYLERDEKKRSVYRYMV